MASANHSFAVSASKPSPVLSSNSFTSHTLASGNLMHRNGSATNPMGALTDSSGSHSRESSHSLGASSAAQPEQHHAVATQAAKPFYQQHRLAAGSAYEGSSIGQASASPSPSRSSFGAESAVSMTTDGRPPLRCTLSDGVAHAGPSFTSPFYSSASAGGSASNLSASLAPPSLVHSLSNSSIGTSSLASPLLSGSAAFMGMTGSASGPGSALGSLYGSQTRQPTIVTPPQQGPLSPSDQRTSLLVLNLPFKIRWQDLKDLFRRSAGTVLRADVSLTPDGLSRGFGSVLMQNAEDAQRAKECFDGCEWMGRRLEVHIEKGGGGGWDVSGHVSPFAPMPTTLGDSPSPYPGQPGQSIPQSFVSHTSNLAGELNAYANVDPLSGSRSPSLTQHTAEKSLNGTLALPSFTHPSQDPRGSFSSGFLTPSGAATVPQSPISLVSDERSRRPSAASSAVGLPPHDVSILHSGSGCSYVSTTSLTPTVPSPQAQQLRASFPGGSRRPSAQVLSVSGGSAGGPQPQGFPSSSLPVAPFPLPAMSSSVQSNISPGTIPTQHQLAVLSAQAAQAAVAAQQAKVLSDYGGMPDGSYYGRTLFVGNLSYATQWQDLKDLFRSAGNILRADIALGSEGRSRGFGTALFGTKDEAARAVRMFHGYDHNGRTLKVHFDRFARMEGPPPGLLVPARAEDYTSAFSAAQPPSNVGANGGLIKTSTGASFTRQSGQASEMSYPHPQMNLMQQPQMQHQYYDARSASRQPPQPQHALFAQQQQRRRHGHVTSARPPAQAPDASSMDPALAQGSHALPSGHAHFTTKPGGSLVSGQSSLLQPFDESCGNELASQTPSNFSALSSGADGKEGANMKPEAAAEQKHALANPISAHPGRISLPSPLPICRQFSAQQMQQQPSQLGQQHATGFAGRVPMPMTPGVPLTPGMPGFTFASLPPQTPPTFSGPFVSGRSMLSPQMGSYHLSSTPGVPAPPTPWQNPSISAAPGAFPGHPMQGPATPRGASHGTPGGSSFNPFFAHAIPGGPVVQNMPQTPHWGQLYRPVANHTHNGSQRPGLNAVCNARVDVAGTDANQRAQSLTSQGGPSSEQPDESALSSRSASSSGLSGVNATSEGYPFPEVVDARGKATDAATEAATQSTAKAVASPEKARSNGVSSIKPSFGPAGFPLMNRRASTNSPAVSPKIAVAAGHTSTEEMARAIAKMSIQGKALLKRGNNNQSQLRNDEANGAQPSPQKRL